MGINTLSFDKVTMAKRRKVSALRFLFQLATKIMDKLIRDGRVIRGSIEYRRTRDRTTARAQGGGIDNFKGSG